MSGRVFCLFLQLRQTVDACQDQESCYEQGTASRYWTFANNVEAHEAYRKARKNL